MVVEVRRIAAVMKAVRVPPEGEDMSLEDSAFMLSMSEMEGQDVEAIGDGGIFIHRRAVRLEARPGDWIVCNEHGTLSVYKAVQFERLFEKTGS